MSTPVIAAPIRVSLQIFIGAECRSNFQVAYVDHGAGRLVRTVDLTGRTFRLIIRKDDTTRAVATDTDLPENGAINVMEGDSSRIAIFLPSTLTTAFGPGRYTFSILDKTDAATGAIALIARGPCYVDHGV